MMSAVVLLEFPPGMSLAQFVVCALAIALATTAQRVTGQAFGLICAPMIALVAPQQVPALVVLCGFPVMLRSLRLDWHALDRAEISFALAGRLVGAVLAGWLLTIFRPGPAIDIAVAASVLLGLGASSLKLGLPIHPGTLSVAGCLSGLMATMASVGAPPMALLYQHQTFAHARATLNAFFFFGALMSIVALSGFGHVTWPHCVMFIWLMPAIGLGIACGDWLMRRGTMTTARPLALGLSLLAALLLMVRAGLGFLNGG